MSTCKKPEPHKTRIEMHTKAEKLTEKSSFSEVLAAVEDVKSRIEWWHTQETDPIYNDAGTDWCGCRYLLLMLDGTYRTARSTVDESMDGWVHTYLEFFDGKETGEEVDETQIKMWLRVAENDRFDVTLDGTKIGG